MPDDGYYYVLYQGKARGRFRSLAKATKCYVDIRVQLDLTPSPPQTLSFEEMRRREMESLSNKMLLWTDEDYARVNRMTQRRPTHGGGRP